MQPFASNTPNHKKRGLEEEIYYSNKRQRIDKTNVMGNRNDDTLASFITTTNTELNDRNPEKLYESDALRVEEIVNLLYIKANVPSHTIEHHEWENCLIQVAHYIRHLSILEMTMPEPAVSIVAPLLSCLAQILSDNTKPTLSSDCLSQILLGMSFLKQSPKGIELLNTLAPQIQRCDDFTGHSMADCLWGINGFYKDAYTNLMPLLTALANRCKKIEWMSLKDIQFGLSGLGNFSKLAEINILREKMISLLDNKTNLEQISSYEKLRRLIRVFGRSDVYRINTLFLNIVAPHIIKFQNDFKKKDLIQVFYLLGLATLNDACKDVLKALAPRLISLLGQIFPSSAPPDPLKIIAITRGLFYLGEQPMAQRLLEEVHPYILKTSFENANQIKLMITGLKLFPINETTESILMALAKKIYSIDMENQHLKNIQIALRMLVKRTQSAGTSALINTLLITLADKKYFSIDDINSTLAYMTPDTFLHVLNNYAEKAEAETEAADAQAILSRLCTSPPKMNEVQARLCLVALNRFPESDEKSRLKLALRYS